MDLERDVALWMEGLGGSDGLEKEDAEELESHLWDCIEMEMYAGTPADEAFKRATERLGEPRGIIAEFAIHYREVSMELERQIEEKRDDAAWLEDQYHRKPQVFSACLARVLERQPDAPVLRAWKERLSYVPFRADRRGQRRDLLILIALCAVSALAVKLPALWGVSVFRIDGGANSYYIRNFAFLFLPMIAFYYAFTQRLSAALSAALIGVFAVSAVAVNLMPAVEPYQTRILSALHLPLMLWLAVGVAFCGAEWRSPTARLDFLRSTGEIFIYSVLILLGGGVLTMFTLGIFSLIGIDIKDFYLSSVAAAGLFAAPIVAVYITEKKRELVDRFAPVLSYIFTPLFLVTLVAFLAAMLALGKSPYTDRDFLIIFNGMLVLVLALTFFNITARKLGDAGRLMDILNAALIIVALAVDCVALSAILVRLASFGASANRIAVLGENILLLATLVGLAVQYVGYGTGKKGYSAVENWTMRLLEVYGAWFAVVVFAFPFIFGFA